MFDTAYRSIFWGVSPIVLTVGLVYHVIGFACSNWLEDKECYVGLWSHGCYEQKLEILQLNATERLSHTLEYIDSWFHATQVLEALALVCVIICVLTGLLRVNHGHLKWQAVCAFTAFLAGILASIGGVVFGVSQPRPSPLHLSWAYVFSTVGGGFCLFASPFIYLDSRWQT